jgi:DNA (cytosine-5)-methyltransferase 1
MSGKVAKRLRKELNPELSSHVIGAHNIDEVIGKITKREVAPQFLIIDLFCGAGGTSTGFEMAGDLALVVACVNHDYKAIKSHWQNHPHVAHFEEDMRKLDLTPLVILLEHYKCLYPDAIVILWASLECTNFSKAKGGQPRDADSRTLADHLDRYVIALQPDYVQIENVVEFMSWGPMRIKAKRQLFDRTELCIIKDKKSNVKYGWQPLSKKNGQDWLRWRKSICSHGFIDEWKELNSANYGAYTSRNRLFGIFARPGLPIVWPAATHAKKPGNKGLYESLSKWMPVKDLLDFSDEGESIFNRKVPLVDSSLERINAGLIKFVANGDTSFIQKHFSGKPLGKVIPISGPTGVITTSANQSLVQACFLTIYNGKSLHRSIDEPSPVIACNDRLSLIQPFLMPTNYDNKPVSIDLPSPTITANRKYHYLVNPSHGGHCTSADQPCPVIIARQDKAPLYLITAETGSFSIPIYDTDSDVMIRIKQFMAYYGIVDIKMRMLRVKELLSIQGFPAGYKLEGNQADQKKFIGNSVVPLVVQRWTEALGSRLIETYNQKIA